ncbi:MAG: hypothetical protein Q4G70_15095 [Pseudomonadota bacterium]|nr:hypothetical protein [Pseudomonadota bacterium]
MNPITQDQDHWLKDYGWAQRGGAWNEDTDVLLVGTVASGAPGADALNAWVAQQDKSQGRVDGVEREIFYAGGVRGYLETSEDGTALYLHSRGEDAFDSLSHYSGEVARFLRAQGCDTPLQWTEARHDRADRQLVWP